MSMDMSGDESPFLSDSLSDHDTNRLLYSL